MDLAEAVAALIIAAPDALDVYSQDGAVYIVLPQGTQLRGRHDTFEGFHIFYRHDTTAD